MLTQKAFVIGRDDDTDVWACDITIATDYKQPSLNGQWPSAANQFSL